MAFKVKGQESQHARLRLTIVATNATRELFTFSKIDYKVGAKKKPTKNSQGQIDGFTIGEMEASGNLTMRRTEFLAMKRWLKQQYPDVGIGQIELVAQVEYGSSIADLDGEDKVEFMFDEEPFSSESNQEAHMVELPLFVTDVEPKEGRFIEYRE